MKLQHVAAVGLVILSACKTDGGADSSLAGEQMEAAGVPGTIIPSPSNAYFTLSGSSATALYNAMTAQAVAGEKKVSGKGTLSCDVTVSAIPPGAQGISAPMASCAGYPHVNFPPGTAGIVLPWFHLNGFAGFELYGAFPAQADESGDKSETANFAISCKQSPAKCVIVKTDAQPTGGDELFTLDGFAAKKAYDDLHAQDVLGTKKVSGDMSLYCVLQIGAIPPGAQGIAAPSAACAVYPNVTFPAGAQGLVLAYLQLNGLAGYAMYDALQVTPNVDNSKEYKGQMTLSCTKAGTSYSCKATK